MPSAVPCTRVAPASMAAMRVHDRQVAVAVAVPVDAASDPPVATHARDEAHDRRRARGVA